MWNSSSITSTLDLEENWEEDWAYELEKEGRFDAVKAIVGEISLQKKEVGEAKSFRKIGDDLLQANYEADGALQEVIRAVKFKNRKILRKENKRFGEVFDDLRVEGGLLFYDERLVIPRDLRHAIMNSLHLGHPGRDAMLSAVSDIWWPELHRQVVVIAQACKECEKAGKSLKTMLKQKQVGKLERVNGPNEKVSLDFLGPFVEASKKKRYILAAIDEFSGWVTAKFCRDTGGGTVKRFLNEFICENGIPKVLKTDQASVFLGKEFREFRKIWRIRHEVCPSGDHRGNGKIERMMRNN